MPVVRIFMPPNRLAGVIGGPDDPTIASLIRDAEARIAPLAPAIRRTVLRLQSEIAALAQGPEEALFSNSAAIDRAAMAICEVAASAGLDAIGEAARGIHAMADALVRQGVWHTEALMLHIDALALFSQDPPPSGSEAGQILTRLKAMRDWVGVPD